MLAHDPELQRRIGGAVEELDRVIGDLRNYIFGLRPGILADRHLDQALRRLAEELEHKTGVVTVVEVDPQAAAALAEVAAEVVQLAREALSNVSRHAQATTCWVSLYEEGATVVLEVDDDGRGFNPVNVRPGGQGLANLRVRALAIGGRSSSTAIRVKGRGFGSSCLDRRRPATRRVGRPGSRRGPATTSGSP